MQDTGDEVLKLPNDCLQDIRSHSEESTDNTTMANNDTPYKDADQVTGNL